VKIARKQLRNIIKEEINRLLREQTSNLVARWTDIYPNLVRAQIIREGDDLVIVNGPSQKLYIVDSSNNNIRFKTSTSTGAKGFGNGFGSGQTSTGLMRIANIIGQGGPRNAVYVGKKLTNPIITIDTNQPSPRPGHAAEVLTRILVLSGVEEKNRNVFGRSIYIHGTNLEYTLGGAHSGGCVRVSNSDVINLADGEVSSGTHAYIYPGGTQTIDYGVAPPIADVESYEEIEDDIAYSQPEIEMGQEIPVSFPPRKKKKIRYGVTDPDVFLRDLDDEINEAIYDERAEIESLEDDDIGTVDGIPATPEEIENVLIHYPAEENA